MPTKSKINPSQPPKSQKFSYKTPDVLASNIPKRKGDNRDSDPTVMKPYSPNHKMQRIFSDMRCNDHNHSLHPAASCVVKGSKGEWCFKPRYANLRQWQMYNLVPRRTACRRQYSETPS